VSGIRSPKPQRLRPAVPAVLAFGSNLGDREGTIRAAIDELEQTPGVHVRAVSTLIQSIAVKLDGADETAPRYLNGVALIDTTLSPHELLDLANAIEARHGRVREERWGDRTLDIDLIDVGGMRIDDERLTLPHPRAAERDFVLAPWLELDPDATVPDHGPVTDLLARLTASAGGDGS
jgi:2-amino-4-hydroxy-6-hydroxymethyldihydropteridine diphosphokinase